MTICISSNLTDESAIVCSSVIVVLITTTKYSRRSNHAFIVSEFLNLLYLYLDLVTFTFIVLFPGAIRIFWCLVIVIFSLLLIV